MYKLIALFCLIAAAYSAPAPAPKPVVVYPQVLPSLYHPPLVHHAPVAVSHVSTLLGHPPVLPAYRTVLPAPLLHSPYLY